MVNTTHHPDRPAGGSVTETRTCPGFPKGTEAHEAPAYDFPGKTLWDTGGRLCSADSEQAKSFYKARKMAQQQAYQARKRGNQPTVGESIVDAYAAEIDKALQVGKPAKPKAVKGTVHSLEATVVAVGGVQHAPEPEINGESPEATQRRLVLERQLDKADADERQALMAKAAKDADQSRLAAKRERQRIWVANKRAAERAAKAAH